MASLKLSEQKKEDLKQNIRHKAFNENSPYVPTILTTAEDLKKFYGEEAPDGTSTDGLTIKPGDLMVLNDQIIDAEIEAWKERLDDENESLFYNGAMITTYVKYAFMDYISMFTLKKFLDYTYPEYILDALLLSRDGLSQLSTQFDEVGNIIPGELTSKAKEMIVYRFLTPSGVLEKIKKRVIENVIDVTNYLKSFYKDTDNSTDKSEKIMMIFELEKNTYKYLKNYCDWNNIHYKAMSKQIESFLDKIHPASYHLTQIEMTRSNTQSIFSFYKKRKTKKKQKVQMDNESDEESETDEKENVTGGDTVKSSGKMITGIDDSKYHSDDTSDYTSDDTSDYTSDDTSDEEATSGKTNHKARSLSELTDTDKNQIKLNMAKINRHQQTLDNMGNNEDGKDWDEMTLEEKWDAKRENFQNHALDFLLYYSELPFFFKVIKDLSPEQSISEIEKFYTDVKVEEYCKDYFYRHIIEMILTEKKIIETPGAMSFFPLHTNLLQIVNKALGEKWKHYAHIKHAIIQKLKRGLNNLHEENNVEDLYFLTGRVKIPLCGIQLMEEIIEENKRDSHEYTYPIM